ncbi:MAG: acetyl-CoA decarbonylase/synthase complex subunit alpha [Methanobacterium sp.]|nr:MAG: acetyl-CoA decarbonylase/synthase complex subunit alpha [Methanobacterium sp.]
MFLPPSNYKDGSSFSARGLNVDFDDIDSYIKEKKEVSKAYAKSISLDYPKLREWDFKLLSHFKPFYAPLCDMCCMCTYGKCDLSENKKGACGINLEKQQSRLVLLTSCIGASTHAAHARDMVDRLLEHDPERELKYDSSIDITSPIITTLTGIIPQNASDLDQIMACVEKELTNLMASAHTGQEGDYLDFESKALHAGMIDNLSLEIAEIAQINLYDLNKGQEDTPLLEIGMGVIDREKPVILAIGHSIAPGTEIIDYAEKMEVEEDLEICGLCCSAIELGRTSSRSKIVGPISRQLMFIKSGAPDVVVLDEQCIRADIFELCAENHIPIIATSDKCSLGLPDKTDEAPAVIINEILKGELPGVLIRDVKKVGQVAVELSHQVKECRKTAQEMKTSSPEDLKLTQSNGRCYICSSCGTDCEGETLSLTEHFAGQECEDPQALIEECIECGQCDRVCPVMLPLTQAIKDAKTDDKELMASFYGKCVGCGKCSEECSQDMPMVNLIRWAAQDKIEAEKFLIRSGRGPIQDVEIRRVGAPIVFGDIPGVLALAGCSNYSQGEKEVALIAEEYLKRGYIVVAAGCAAMDIALYKDEDGETLYEKYSDRFDKGGLLNLGPCVANAHAIGSAIKIANIFARVPLEKNFVDISDYILNRIGVCVIAWGAMSQKAFAIATGANRWGIPTIIGPQASKYRRLYLGNEEEPRTIKDKRDGSTVVSEPAPVHLAYSAESMNECMVMTAKMCIRPNDTPKGRLIKLTNYVDIHQKYYGILPSDLVHYIRDEKEIPFKYKDEILNQLKDAGWEPRMAAQEPSIL